MKKYMHYSTLLVSIILTLCGFLIVTNSIENATDSMNSYIKSMGGILATIEAEKIETGYIIINITQGGILFLVGLIFLCFSIYNLTKKND